MTDIVERLLELSRNERGDPIDDAIDEIKRLRTELDTARKIGIDALNANTVLRAEIAESQAREAKLRDALMDGVAHLAAAVSAYEKFVGRADRRGHRDPFFSTRFSDFTKAEERTRETLALPHDDTALKERLAKERERCALVADVTVCDTHLPTGVRVFGSRAADAIRNLGDGR